MNDITDRNTTAPTIAVFGLGRMGTPMAHNLLAAGFSVVVWNRQPERVTALVEAGATAAPSPAQAAARADIILTMLTDGNATADVFAGPTGIIEGAKPGTIWIQMATIGLDWT